MEAPGSFGEWLKRRRKTLDLTQEELAERAGCSIFALRKIESGERRPSKQLAGLLAAALEITEQERATFIRVARGDLNLERLRISKLDTPHASISDLLILQQTQKSASFNADPGPASHHLPLPPTPLLGREPELAALERLFKDPQCRLLTLTGMGGIGKTRLAIEFALRQQDLFSDGVHYVPLASIHSADSIIPAIADVLGYGFSGPGDLKEQLIKHMSVSMKRPSLLVLDNLEHLISQSSDTVELVCNFLQRLPSLKILCTSRERLSLHGEWTYELYGLPTPPLEYVGKLEDYSGAVLFIQCARRINAGFELTDSEKPALVRICHLLEGIPLAIELAAAWAGMLSCTEIAKEIESNIDFLTTSTRNMPERHRSLRATFDHSWKLLSDHERKALCRLSVFHGGFKRNAAEQIADAALPLLASLVAKSLVRHTKDGRYDLHEVIRQYALSHLNEDQSQAFETRDRHCQHYLNLVADREKALKSAKQQEAMRELTREIDNIHAAWRWGIEQEKFGWLEGSVRSLGWMYEVGGLLREGIEQLDLLVQVLKVDPRNNQWDRVLGLALIHQGLLYFREGQFDRSQELYQEGIAILRPLADHSPLADALIFLGIITHLNGDYTQSQSLLREGLACAQAAHDQWFAAFGIYNLGYIDSLMGDYEKGYQQMQTGLHIWRALGDPHSIALGLNYLVSTLIQLKRYEEAEAYMQESIALCEQTRNRWGMGTAYRFLGLVTMAEGQCIEAQAHFRKSIEIFGGYIEGWDIARSLTYLAQATMTVGDLPEARTIYLDALRLAIKLNAAPIAMDSLLGLAKIYWRVGDVKRAFGLSSLVLNHAASTQETKDHALQIKQEAKNHLSNEQIRALRAGRLNRLLEGVDLWMLSR
ncbi:MAG TPA: tetratricopeptide repeat protein [Anaerolineales bacterium]